MQSVNAIVCIRTVSFGRFVRWGNTMLNKTSIQRVFLIFSDMLSLVLSLTIVKFMLFYIRPGIDHISLHTFGVAKFGGFLLIAVFWYQEQYVKRRPIWEEVRLIFHTVFLFALFHMVFSYLLSHHVVKLPTVLFWMVLLCVLPCLRYITKCVLAKCGIWQRNVYIIGTESTAISAYMLLMTNKILGYNFLGFVDPRNSNGVGEFLEVNGMELPIISLDNLYANYAIDEYTEIIFAMKSSELFEHARVINILQTKYTFVSIVPDITGLPLYGVELEHFFGNDQLFLRLQNSLSRRSNRIIKRCLDIVVSLFAILVLAPFLLIIAIFVKFSTNGNIIFKHQRIGRGGKIFSCMKFQTMFSNSQEILANLLANDEAAKHEWERDFKLKNDPRVTRVGKFLRKTSLDELPQLFNVILGDMSLVGPRPVITEELLRYGDDAYYYKLVRPGITGLWQISGRNDVDYITRVRLDVCYTKNWSLWYDFVILFRTLFVVLAKSGAY